jgi:solute carrier family 35 protein C2
MLRNVSPSGIITDRISARRIKAAPTAVTTGLDIGLSNLSLKTITLSFYSMSATASTSIFTDGFRYLAMVKSSSLIFVLLFAFLFRLEHPSWRLTGVISLITAGVLLMVATEADFYLTGFILVLSASALGGLRWSLTQLLLKNRDMGMDNPVSTLFWLAPVMGVTLGMISMVVDGWGNVFRSEFFQETNILSTCFYLTAPGVVAAFMVLSEF